MSGDCGGTNSRFVLFRVSNRASLLCGQPPEGECVFSKKYLNSEQQSFSAVCKLFLEEAGGLLPMACCLACAGAITGNQQASAHAPHPSESARPACDCPTTTSLPTRCR
jgi:glucokinase